MTRRALGLVFALALGVRLVCALELADAPFVRVLLGDALVFDAWARELAAGNWWGDEVFYQAPLYPYFLGVVRALGGDDATARLVQAFLGAAGATLVAAATGRLFDARAGLVAGVLSALYAPSVWLDGLVQKTALALLLSGLLLYLLASRTPRAFLLGLVLALLVLVRENALVLLVPVVMRVLQAPEARGRALGATLAGLLLVLGPVGLRNASLGGGFLPTASNFGVNFAIGNDREADGLYRPLVAGRGHAVFEREDATLLAEADAGRELSSAGVSLHWLGRGVRDVLDAPGRWALLMGWKGRLVLHRTEVMDAEAFEAHREHSRLLDALGLALHFGLLLPLAALGIASTWRERPELRPFHVAPLLLAASVVLFFVAARFRAGLVPFLVPFAAQGALRLVALARDPAEVRASWRALTLTALAAVLANAPLGPWPWSLAGDPVATTESNLASELLRRGSPGEALAHARRAVELDPGSANAHYNRGLAARGTGNGGEARAGFLEARRLEPAYAADAALQLGTLLAESGDLEDALVLFEEAVAAEPGNARAHYNRGLALRLSGRLEEARAAYETSIRLAPEVPDAHHNLGAVLERLDLWHEAINAYRAALVADPEFVPSLERLAFVLARHGDPHVRNGDWALGYVHRLLALVEPGSEPTSSLYDLLAAAQAAAGDFDAARDIALDAARKAQDPAWRRTLEERAALYAEGVSLDLDD
jgi:tetratricopeptide (TPR) repeat protein